MGDVPPTRKSSRPQRDRRLVAFAAVLLAAAAVVVAVIVFSPFPPDPDGQRRLAAWLAAVHQTWMPRWVTFDLIEFVSNVAMFLPLGLFGGIVFARARSAVIAICLVFSVAVELVQWALLPARQADWRDVVANVVGAAIGVALAALVLRLITRRAATSRTVGGRETNRDELDGGQPYRERDSAGD
jgi:glycopeptide antibiotics resistance protein